MLFAAALPACVTVPGPQPPPPPRFSIHAVSSASSPSPLVEIQAGRVEAVVPEAWDARPLPATRYPQQGFVASPRILDWEKGVGAVNGMEAFWIDEGNVGIPSDYYYLVARVPAFGYITNSEACQQADHHVFVNHPLDPTGDKFSPSDYVASATGVCGSQSHPLRWAYVVAAPGFGPLRRVGIPSSGLYVVLAVVSGAKSDILLDEMINGARFDNTSVSELERAAVRSR